MTSSSGKQYWGFERVHLGAGRKPSGPFWLRHTDEQGNQKWVSAGDDYKQALEVAEKLRAKKHAEREGVPLDESDRKTAEVLGGKTLKDAVEEFMTAKRHKRPRTLKAYRTTLENFKECLGHRVRLTIDLKEDHVQQFVDCMTKQGLKPKTIRTRVMYVSIFLNHIESPVKVEWEDLPKIPTVPVKAYSPEHLKALMDEADEEELALFRFLMGTGCRESEAQHAEYSDIDFAHRLFTIQEKPQWGFIPKSWEHRQVTLPVELVELLKERQRHSDASLIFPSTTGKPDGHLLRIIKGVAFRAGLNCKKCMAKQDGTKVRSCKDHPVCKEHFTHRVRKTFATRMHHAGVPLRDLQKMLGHKHPSTTEKYLAESDLKAAHIRAAADKAFAI